MHVCVLLSVACTVFLYLYLISIFSGLWIVIYICVCCWNPWAQIPFPVHLSALIRCWVAGGPNPFFKYRTTAHKHAPSRACTCASTQKHREGWNFTHGETHPLLVPHYATLCKQNTHTVKNWEKPCALHKFRHTHKHAHTQLCQQVLPWPPDSGGYITLESCESAASVSKPAEAFDFCVSLHNSHYSFSQFHMSTFPAVGLYQSHEEGSTCVTNINTSSC